MSRYIIQCKTKEEAESLFRAFDMIGISYPSFVFNINNNYCWDVHRRQTYYYVDDKCVLSYGKFRDGICSWAWGNTKTNVEQFVKKEVRLYHRIKYWIKNLIK